MYTIYCHTNKINGKKYIGLTSRSLERRWQSHCAEAYHPNNPNYLHYFKLAIRKYGKENWDHEILEQVETIEEANEIEIKYISLYKTNNRNLGYNIEPGGKYRKMAESTKEKLRLIKLGTHQSKESNNKNRISQYNKKKRSGCYSKYVGVSFCKKLQKWTSQISLNKKTINLGYFLTEEKAYETRINKLKELDLFKYIK